MHSAEVGPPRWSSTILSSSRSLPSRRIVVTQFLDDYHRIRVHAFHITDNRFNRPGVKVISYGVIISGHGNHHILSPGESLLLIRGSFEFQLTIGQKVFDLCIDNRRFTLINQRHFIWNDIEGNHLMMLR